MSKHLTRDLEDLQRRVMGMAARVEEAIYAALVAMKQRDCHLARKVVAADEAVDALENEIYEECLRMIAMHQPVAIDLRQIAATFMVTTDLERMGDLAVEIAERAAALAGLLDLLSETDPTGDSLSARLQRLADLCTSQVRESLDAFINMEPATARRVMRLDAEVDRAHAEIIRDLIARMRSSAAAVEPGLSLFSTVRSLERIADHATNIAEDVVYLTDGDIVRHRPRGAD
jgi:phosphate transport system protein